MLARTSAGATAAWLVAGRRSEPLPLTDQRNETQQGLLVRTEHANHADRLVDLHRQAVERGFLHGAAVLVGVRGPVEQALDGQIHLAGRLRRAAAGHLFDLLLKLDGARHQILGDVVADLRAIVRRASTPAASRLVRSLHGIANVCVESVCKRQDFCIQKKFVKIVGECGRQFLLLLSALFKSKFYISFSFL